LACIHDLKAEAEMAASIARADATIIARLTMSGGESHLRIARPLP
jgi:hypothetical protein